MTQFIIQALDVFAGGWGRGGAGGLGRHCAACEISFPQPGTELLGHGSGSSES